MTQAIRQIRSETGVKPSITIEEVFLVLPQNTASSIVETAASYVRRQARVDRMTVIDVATQASQGVATAVVSNVEIRIPLKGLIDVEEELTRLRKAIAKVDEDIAFVNRKLNNDKFIGRAPDHIVQKEKDKLSAYTHTKNTLEKSLTELNQLR